MRVDFKAGERRHVELLIHATDGSPFAIRNAKWTLEYSGETESNGECEINGHIIDALISPQKRTTYILRMKFEVADEEREETVEVAVT